MKLRVRVPIIWTTFLSVTFGLLLMPELVRYHGFFKSLAFTLVGVSVIWLAYFGVRSFVLYVAAQSRGDAGKENRR